MATKCFLHIGTEKTGTTTIQSFLKRNQKKLLSRSCAYPLLKTDINHRRLAATCYNVDRRDDFTRCHGLDSDALLADYQARSAREFHTLFSKCKANNAVLSSEHFHSRLITDGEIRRLKSLLHQFEFDQVEVIVFLREQVQLAASIYCMNVKNGSTATKPGRPSNPYFANLCDHRKTLERFIDVFGRERMHVRLFERDQFLNGCLITEFLDVVGIDHRGFQISTPVNERLSDLGMQILRRANQKLPRFLDGRPHPIRLKLIRLLERQFTGTKFQLEPDLADEYRQAFADSNEWVRAKFFPHRENLFSVSTCEDHKTELDAGALDAIAAQITEAIQDDMNEEKNDLLINNNTTVDAGFSGLLKQVFGKWTG